MPCQYPQQFRERALRMVEESLPEQKCEFAAMKKVATQLGISPGKADTQWLSGREKRPEVLVGAPDE